MFFQSHAGYFLGVVAKTQQRQRLAGTVRKFVLIIRFNRHATFKVKPVPRFSVRPINVCRAGVPNPFDITRLVTGYLGRVAQLQMPVEKITSVRCHGFARQLFGHDAQRRVLLNHNRM